MSMASTQKEIKGGHVLAMLLAFFGVIIAVNMVMAYFANSTWSGLVVENGYVASQNFDENLAKAKAQEALGWDVGFAFNKSSVKVTFTDAKGAKIDNLNLASIAELLGKVLPPLSELAKLLPAPAATTSG